MNKILIVDDVSANLKMLSDLLEPEGYHILVAPSGEVALKVAARMRPDLILLDVMMPGLNGFETCQKLKADAATADIPVIFVTAQHETESLVQGFQAGGVDYITKPFERDEIRARVGTHLTLKRLQDSLREANAQIQAKNEELEKSYQLLATENDRKTEELEVARAIQQGFLPLAPPELPFLEIAAFQRTATEVGGDYYDFFADKINTPSKLLVVIGDATGHGVGPSLMVSATKMALMTVDESDLAKRVGKINLLLKQLKRDHLLNFMALTLIELVCDAALQVVDVKAAGGGMPPLYILRSNGEVKEVEIIGLPLGATEREKYQLVEFQLAPSDLLIAMSDGLPERLNDKGEVFGYEELAAEIKKAGKTRRSATDILEALVSSSDVWSNQTPQNDDMTLVVMKVLASN